jgi:hypothetical protein
MQITDLRSILNLYLYWFDRGYPCAGRVAVQPRVGSTSPGQAAPDITRIEDAARKFLADTLPPDLPVHFALSVIEALAYTTSRFASADRANGLVYRAAVLRILEAGLLSQAASRPE